MVGVCRGGHLCSRWWTPEEKGAIKLSGLVTLWDSEAAERFQQAKKKVSLVVAEAKAMEEDHIDTLC